MAVMLFLRMRTANNLKEEEEEEVTSKRIVCGSVVYYSMYDFSSLNSSDLPK